MSLIGLAPKIVAGSALAGFGLAFGRDVYRQVKKNWLILAVVGSIVFLLFGIFISAVWVSRNYKTWAGSLFKRIGAILSLCGCYVVTYFLILFVDFLIETDPEQIDVETVLAHDTGTAYLVGLAIQNLILLAGLVVGLRQRRKRGIAWDTEASNVAFFEEHGLELLDDENFRDEEGNRYRLKNVFRNEMEFQAEGRRGKRGYIQFDENGKYVSWSGLTNIA